MSKPGLVEPYKRLLPVSIVADGDCVWSEMVSPLPHNWHWRHVPQEGGRLRYPRGGGGGGRRGPWQQGALERPPSGGMELLGIARPVTKGRVAKRMDLGGAKNARIANRNRPSPPFLSLPHPHPSLHSAPPFLSLHLPPEYRFPPGVKLRPLNGQRHRDSIRRRGRTGADPRDDQFDQ